MRRACSSTNRTQVQKATLKKTFLEEKEEKKAKCSISLSNSLKLPPFGVHLNQLDMAPSNNFPPTLGGRDRSSNFARDCDITQ